MKINGIYLMGCWLLVVGYWLLVVGCRLLVVGCCLSVVGCWLLVVGYRLLVVGYWLLVAGLDCPVTRVTQWLAGAHETDILTDNRKPITNNRQPPPYKCLRKKSRARF